MSTTTFEVFTLFPQAVEGFVGAGLLGKAIERGLVAVHCTDIREFARDRHRTVDDAPFGGGAGMVMKAEPVVAALEAVVHERGPLHRILLTPSAPRFDHRTAERLAGLSRVGLVCGRYEGIDDRVREHFVDECLSIGDFVLGGGEVAALVVIEAVSRLCEGVVGNPESIAAESFATGLLEHPQYTRPAEFRGHAVPEVLLQGNHVAIARWREQAARARTRQLRPDLRPVARIPADLPIHMLVDADVDPEPGLAAVLRRHGVASLVVLDRERGGDGAARWLTALAGKVQVASFPGLAAWRRRVSQRGGSPPWVVALVGSAESDPRVLHNGPEVVDGLASAIGAPAALGVWIVGARSIPAADPDVALFSHSGTAALPDREPLASGPMIADASRPSLADLADRALTSLRATT